MFGADSTRTGKKVLDALSLPDLSQAAPRHFGKIEDLKIFKNNLMTQVLFAQKLPDDVDEELQVDLEKDFLGTGLAKRQEDVINALVEQVSAPDERRILETYRHALSQLKYLVPPGSAGQTLSTLMQVPEAMSNFERATYAETAIERIELYENLL